MKIQIPTNINTIKKLTALTLILSGLVLAGCASIVDGTSQDVRVKVVNSETNKPISGAVCQFTSQKDNVFTTNQNPGSFHIKKNQGNLSAHCVAKGYKQQNLGVTQDIDAWILGDLIFIPTVIIDLVNSAYHEYPEYVIITMDPVKK